MKRDGFTLIELTLVLFLLALAAHLGVREMSRVRASRLHGAAARQLDEIAAAVYDDRGGEVSGFLSDMGRLPLASRAAEGAPLDLRELWEKPAGLGWLRARPASAENLAPGAPPEIADAAVLVPCGWGGPYIRLPAGADRLRDPWGNPFETPDAAGLARLLDAGLGAVDATNRPVAAVRHFGSDGMREADRPAALPEQADALRVFETNAAGALFTFEPGSVTRLCWYAPLGDKVTGGVVEVPAGASQALAAGLPPGVRFFKVFRADGTTRIVQAPLRAGRDAALSL